MTYRPVDAWSLDAPRAYGSDGGRFIANLTYALYIAGFFTGVTALAGVALAYARRGSAAPMVRSHLDWQIRIFWHCILAGIAIFVLHALVIGLGALTFGLGLVFMVVPWGIGAWWLVWTIWAIAKGLRRLGNGLPIR